MFGLWLAGGSSAEPIGAAMTITISPELVSLVRDGLYLDLQGRLEDELA